MLTEFDARAATQRTLAALWTETLAGLARPDEIDGAADFFALGADSLLATRLAARAHAAFGVEVTVQDVFEHPTLSQLSKMISTRDAVAAVPPIRPVGRSLPLNMSSQQRGIWLAEQLRPGTSQYNVPLAWRIDGPLDIEALRRALDETVERHEPLRTVFATADGDPVQIVRPASSVPLEIATVPPSDDGVALTELVDRVVNAPFDLAGGPPLRVLLARMAPERHVLVLVIHHIVSDQWSNAVIIRELSQRYRGHPTAAPLHVQYGDFSVWEHGRLSERGETLLAYWRTQLADLPAVELPTDRPRPVTRSAAGATLRFTLPDSLIADLDGIGRHHRATRFMTFYAVFLVLVHRYTGQTDLPLLTSVAGRNHPQLDHLVGSFVNTVLLRTEVQGTLTFEDLLARARDTAVKAFAHQELPFEHVVRAVRAEADGDRTPLSDILFEFQNSRVAPLVLGDTTVEELVTYPNTSRYDLLVSFRETTQGLAGEIEYSTDLYDQSTVERLAEHYQTLLSAVVENPKARLADLRMLTVAEADRMTREWNATSRSFPGNRCLHELVSEQAARTPDATAVLFEGQTLSYADLEARANRLAHHLRGRGVGPETPVGVLVERSLDLVVCLLATLKAGGAFVPLEPSYPPERLGLILRQAATRMVITQPMLRERVPDGALQIVDLVADAGVIDACSSSAPRSMTDPRNLAYVVFTSGSTGVPKGIAAHHRGINNYLTWMQADYPLGPQDRVLQAASIGFDVAVWEIFWPLLVGAATVIPRPGGHRDPLYLVRLIEEAEVSTMHLVPSLLQVFVEHTAPGRCRSLRYVFSSAEPLTVALRSDFFATLDAQLVNLYGATEVSVDSTHWLCRSADGAVVPVGRPIANTSVFVLDRYGGHTPVGVVGEIFLGGESVCRGYLRRPALTAERFVPDPSGHGRVYRTGDMGRWRADGSLEFLGRRDHQVKIRGVRVELGEVETALLQHTAVRRVAAVLRKQPAGTPRLVAYLVPQPGCSVDPAELRRFLGERLPEAMIPSMFHPLDELPINDNGKIDRAALPEVDTSTPARGVRAPRTGLEMLVARMWADALGLDAVGVDDDFFDLGGHSLVATRILAKITEILHVKVPMTVLFEQGTVGAIAAHIEANETEPGAIDRLVRVAQIMQTAETPQPSGMRAENGAHR
ncbi:amino acid adenylation domain-containing protein [Dactylosporangium sp. NPDC050588]|uniref:amino acid adenylation domain-containing protein n=1 Tax=Dactylosporangium sp. NPDC050588 TaxID=3157211 RepID=UPI00341188A0